MGVSQVSVAMKIANATWISAMLQPRAWWIGLTNSVQPYCRLAISTMHNTPSHSCSQRFPALLSDIPGLPRGYFLIVACCYARPLAASATDRLSHGCCLANQQTM